MRFRPCIDIHNGKVKQIIGGSLSDAKDEAQVNFTASKDADYFANIYRRDGLTGGHVILLNPISSEYYKETLKQAEKALRAYPGGLQLGGGVNEKNAEMFLRIGASHVIVTSYVFCEGRIRWDNLEMLKRTIGKENIVVDLSCRKKADDYYIVTNRWQKFTEEKLSVELLDEISEYCDEFLVHGVDVEGLSCGVDERLADLLAAHDKIPVTYAGGIGSLDDLKKFKRSTKGRVDFTIGSALDIFGGKLPYDVVKFYE